MINSLFLLTHTGYSMIKKMTGGFNLILVVAYLTLVGADDLQEINYKGKTNDSFHCHKLMC